MGQGLKRAAKSEPGSSQHQLSHSWAHTLRRRMGPQQVASAQPPLPPLPEGSKATAADCLACRLTGLALGVGGGGYVASRLFEQPYPKGAHKYTLVGVSAGLVLLGVGRALGF